MAQRHQFLTSFRIILVASSNEGTFVADTRKSAVIRELLLCCALWTLLMRARLRGHALGIGGHGIEGWMELVVTLLLKLPKTRKFVWSYGDSAAFEPAIRTVGRTHRTYRDGWMVEGKPLWV